MQGSSTSAMITHAVRPVLEQMQEREIVVQDQALNQLRERRVEGERIL